MKKRILVVLLSFVLLLSTVNVYGVEESGTVAFSNEEIVLNKTNKTFSVDLVVDSQRKYSGVEIALNLGTDIEMISQTFPIKDEVEISVNSGSKVKNDLTNLIVFTTDNVFTGKQTVCRLNLKYVGTTKAIMSIVSAQIAYFDVEDTVIGSKLDIGKVTTVSVVGSSTNNNGGSSGATYENIIADNEALPEGFFPVDFKDLYLASWAEEYINYIAARGIVNGVEPDTFDPNGTLTREAYIKMLVESLNLVDENAICSFADISKEAWYYVYIASAEQAGITEGFGDNTFGVSVTISREQMATMTFRALKVVDKQLDKPLKKAVFTDDSKIAQYAVESVYEMQMAGILSGVGGNLFAPTETATRAQAAKIIYMLITK